MAVQTHSSEYQPLLSHSRRPCQGIVPSSSHFLSKESIASSPPKDSPTRLFPLSARAKILLTMVAIPAYLLASSAVTSLGPLTPRNAVIRSPQPSPQAATTSVSDPAPNPFASVLGPLVETNFPDPAIIYIDGVSYAFATNNRGVGADMIHVQVATSTDNHTWTLLDHQDALPHVGAWGTGARVWAPDVVQVVKCRADSSVDCMANESL